VFEIRACILIRSFPSTLTCSSPQTIHTDSIKKRDHLLQGLFWREIARSGVLEEYAKNVSPPGFLRIWRDGGPPPACDGPTTGCAGGREEGHGGAPPCSSPSAQPAAALRACMCPALTHGARVTTPPEIIPYYHLNHSIWSLSDNKESSR
jgi:hypothetical protein